MYKYESIPRYILNEVETFRHTELQLLKKIWLGLSSVIEIVKMKYNRIDIKCRNVSTSFKKVRLKKCLKKIQI
jgi:hypothetical protein